MLAVSPRFGARYLGYDLPPALAEELRALCYVAAPEDLAAKRDQAEALFAATLAEIDAGNPYDGEC